MKKSTLLFGCYLSLLFACQDEKVQIQRAIDEVTRAMTEESFPSKENMEKVIDLYDEYISKYPDAEESFTFMELKAKYLSANNQNEEAIDAYSDLITKYPDAPRAAEALFMQAFIFENYLSDKTKAQEKYNEFLTKYPEHELADDASFSIENMNLSDEQLLQLLKQSNQDSL